MDSPAKIEQVIRACFAAFAGEEKLDFHGEHIATMLTNNAGFNCTASRVIVTAAGWPQRAAILDRVETLREGAARGKR